MDKPYRLTAKQLDKLLTNAIEMYEEYREKHGYDADAAKYLAAAEMIGGLEADRDLATLDGDRLRLQLEPA